MGYDALQMAHWLGMSPAVYLKLEEGAAPDDRTLRHLCGRLDWNYQDLQRLLARRFWLASENTTLKSHLAEDSTTRPSKPDPSAAEPRRAAGYRTLAQRLRQRRGVEPLSRWARQLGLSPAAYRHLEEGGVADESQLRQLSQTLGWRYHEMRDVVRLEQAETWHPPPQGTISRAAQQQESDTVAAEIDTLLAALRQRFTQLPPAKQRELLLQLRWLNEMQPTPTRAL